MNLSSLRVLQVAVALVCAGPVTSFSVASHSGDSGTFGHVLAAEEGAVHSHRKLSDNKKAGVIGGVVFGCLLWCIVPCAIWNNERIAIKQYKIQLKAERWAVHVDDPSKAPLPDMVGRCVYMTGTSTCSERLTDKVFSKVSSEGKIKLRRVIEMRQWRETEKTDKDGNHTGYEHSEVWADYQLECEASGYQNPRIPFNSTKRQEGYCASACLAAGSGDPCEEADHKNIKLGAYYLGEFVIRELNRWEPKKLTEDQLAAGGWFGSHDGCQGEPKEDPEGWWYWGGRKSGVGAVRVRFEELAPGPTSICGNLAQTTIGYTFLPMRRADSVREGAVAEFGGGLGDCCLRVKELHYNEDTEEKAFKESIKDYPMNLDNEQKKVLSRSKTASDVEASGEEDLGDLCCVGPFGSLVVKLLHWLGLEEEFLGVHEEKISLKGLMEKESAAAANRHHMCRVASLILLVVASLCIIAPAVKLLNYNWIISMMGGALISLVLCCGATLLSTATCCCVMSSAWLFYRPILAVFGFAVTAACVFGIYYYIDEQQKHDAGQPSAGTAASLFLQIAAAAVPREAPVP